MMRSPPHRLAPGRSDCLSDGFAVPNYFDKSWYSCYRTAFSSLFLQIPCAASIGAEGIGITCYDHFQAKR